MFPFNDRAQLQNSMKCLHRDLQGAQTQSPRPVLLKEKPGRGGHSGGDGDDGGYLLFDAFYALSL